MFPNYKLRHLKLVKEVVQVYSQIFDFDNINVTWVEYTCCLPIVRKYINDSFFCLRLFLINFVLGCTSSDANNNPDYPTYK